MEALQMFQFHSFKQSNIALCRITAHDTQNELLSIQLSVNAKLITLKSHSFISVRNYRIDVLTTELSVLDINLQISPFRGI